MTKTVVVSRKLASSGSIEGVAKLINQFYVSDKYLVDAATLAISHPTMPSPGSTRVVKRGKRFVFESYRVTDAAI